MELVVEASLIGLASVLMVASMALLLVPVAPTVLLQAIIATLAAALTGFSPVDHGALLLIWLLALVGATAEFWLPFFGMRGQGMGCAGIVAFFIGVILGSMLIPLPILGSVIGGVLAVVGVQLLKMGELRAALRSGGQAAKFLLLSTLAEGVAGLLILVVWFASIAA